MKRMKRVGAGMMLAAALLSGCGKDTTTGPGTPTTSQRCESPAEYLAFDPVHHAVEDLRLQRINEMLALFDDARWAPSKAAADADKVLARYTASDANLRETVKGLVDVHFTPARAVGGELDAVITQSIEELRAATTSEQVLLAQEHFDKDGFARFLFLAMAEKLFAAPSYVHYDEAFGYLGTGETNEVGGQRGLAQLATLRDAANGTTLNPELFALIKDGACTIEGALQFLNADSMEPEADEQYVRMARQIDAKLQLVFAYSMGHELYEYDGTDRATAHLEIAEANGYFLSIEPYMLAAGGAKAEAAQALRAAFDDALAKAAANTDPNWPATVDTKGLLSKLEAAFFIDVKG
jgi:hypothetical protein